MKCYVSCTLNRQAVYRALGSLSSLPSTSSIQLQVLYVFLTSSFIFTSPPHKKLNETETVYVNTEMGIELLSHGVWSNFANYKRRRLGAGEMDINTGFHKRP